MKQDKNDQTYGLSKEELTRFLGVVLLSGYHFFTIQTNLIMVCQLLLKRWTVKGFFKIKGMVHCVGYKKCTVEDGKVDGKVYSSLNQAFVRYGVFYSKLNIDESMVPYFG